jgi:hypothetical protein
MQLSEKFGFQHLDFGHAVTLFIFSLIKITIDCILEGCGSPNNSVDKHVKTYTKSIDSNGNEASLDMGHEHREHLRRKNIHMSVEVVERITANKMVQVFLRLVYRNMYDTASLCFFYLLHYKYWLFQVSYDFSCLLP